MTKVAYGKFACTLLIMCIGLWGIWTASSWIPEDGLYPMGAFGGIALFAAAVAVREIVEGRQARKASREQGVDRQERSIAKNQVLKLIALTVFTSVYVLSWDLLGYVVATLIYIVALLLTLGVRNLLALLAVPVATTAFVYLIFVEVLSIPLP